MGTTITLELHLQPDAKLAQAIRIRTHELSADVSMAEGGDDQGPSPHELYNAALGACKDG